MFRLISDSSLVAVSSTHRRAASWILCSLRPWRGRGFWMVATVVTLTCASPIGQLLGGNSDGLLQDAVPASFHVQTMPKAPESSVPGAADGAVAQEARRWVQEGQTSLRHLAWDQAAEQFARAAELDPSNGDAHLGLAQAHLEAHEPAQALEASQRALYLLGRGTTGSQSHVLANLAHLRASAELARRQDAGRGQTALLEAVEGALQLYPADPGLYVLRGQLEDSVGDVAGGERAIVWMRKALELAPEDPAAHFELSKRLEARGQLRAARQHAALYMDAVQAPAAYVDLARLDWLQGSPAASLDLMRTALARHEQASVEAPRGWGKPAELANTLFLMVALEDELGFVDDAGRHAEQLFNLEVEGRMAGLTCLPALQLSQRRASAEDTLKLARRCGEKASLLAKALGAAYRGEAELASSRLDAARQALQDAEIAHRRLMGDLGPEMQERPFALAAELALVQLRGKLHLLDGERRVGEEQLQSLVDRLQTLEGLEGWLTGRQRLLEIGRVADRTGQFGLAIASARVLEALSPSTPVRKSATGVQPVPEVHANDNWVVWTER